MLQPSIYMEQLHKADSPEVNALMVNSTVAEAVRISSATAHKPAVFPYMYSYFDMAMASLRWLSAVAIVGFAVGVPLTFAAVLRHAASTTRRSSGTSIDSSRHGWRTRSRHPWPHTSRRVGTDKHLRVTLHYAVATGFGPCFGPPAALQSITTSATHAPPQSCHTQTISIWHSHGVACLRAGFVPSLDVAMVSSQMGRCLSSWNMAC